MNEKGPELIIASTGKKCQRLFNGGFEQVQSRRIIIVRIDRCSRF